MFPSRLPILTILCFLFLLDHHFYSLAGTSLTPNYSPVDDNLARPGPVSLPHVSLSSTPKQPKQVLVAFGLGNKIATGVIILITLLNVVVYKLRQLQEVNFGEKHILSLSTEQLCRCFSIVEIQSATHNFDDALVIGKGGFGKVYKGFIDDGRNTVAVKRLDSESKQGAHEFWTEIEMLSKFRHSHLVSLVGYCHDCHEMILVYEYMPHGTLADHLYKIVGDGTSINSQPLSWEQRLKICIGAARGLDYLHTGTAIQHRVIHRDVKSSNILLDENWAAKISDFGLSKIGPANQSCSHVSTNVKGTFGYLDPEYFLTRRITRKSDVYAFGVVLLEVLCGRPAVDLRLQEDKQALALWAQRCIKEGALDQIIDPRLRNQISLHCLKAYVEIADTCLHYHRTKRPTMAEVVARLEFALESHDSSESSIDKELHTDDGGGDSDSSIEHEEVVHHENRIDDIIPVLGDVRGPSTFTFGQSGILMPNMGKFKKKVLQGIKLVTKSRDSWRRKKDSGTSSSTTGPWSWGRWQSLSHRDGPSPLPKGLHSRRFSVAEIRAATNNFCTRLIVDHGSFNNLYRAYLDGGAMEVAIKRLQLTTAGKWEFEYFGHEIVMLSRIHHRHLASLVGYCYDGHEGSLVYEYMSNGSLRDRLYSTDNYAVPRLPWKRRLQICIGVAHGLNHLHTGAPGGQTIVHLDVKPSHILLDENWVPKVFGFELSKLGPRVNDCDFLNTPVTSSVISGTFGYTDPEFIQSSKFTAKSDVYALGAVLMDVILCVHTYDLHNSFNGYNLPEWVKNSIVNETLHQIIDPYLLGKIAPECLVEFVEIALNCLRHRGIERPTMSEVVQGLEFALQLQENAEAESLGIGWLDWEKIYQELTERAV